MQRSLVVFILGSNPESLVNFRGDLIKKMVHRYGRVLTYAPNISPVIEKKLHQYGATCVNFPLHRTSLNVFLDLRAIWTLIRNVITQKPDVLLPYTIKPILYCCLSKIFNKNLYVIPLITGLGYGFGRLNWRQKTVGFFIRCAYRLALNNASGLMFQNVDDANLFRELGLVRKHIPVVVVDGSGVNLNEFPQSPIPRKKTFLFVGRLLRDKGVIEFCKAAEDVKKSGLNAKFWLLGDYDTNPLSLSQRDIQPWLENESVCLLGQTSSVASVLDRCRYFVLPSYREGLPRSTLEALAKGRPIITTNSPGCRETVIDGVNGILVDVKNWRSLASAIKKLAKESNANIKNMGLESRRLAVERFDVRIVNEKIMKFIEKVVSE